MILLRRVQMRQAAEIVTEQNLLTPQNRLELLQGVPEWFTKEISPAEDPIDQLNIDMRALNNAARLEGLERHPFTVWLENAAKLAPTKATALLELSRLVESRAGDEIEGKESDSIDWRIPAGLVLVVAAVVGGFIALK